MKIETQKKRRISSAQGALMIGVALAVDITQIILVFFLVGIVLNKFISIFVFLTFAFWFALNGVSFLTGKKSAQKMLRFFGATFGEIIPIPFLGVVPFWTLGIWLTLRSVKNEDNIAL